MIDITGKPLASMYFMQIVWGLRKEPFIGVRPLNHAKEAPTTGAWQFTNAIDSWSWQGYEGEKAVVEVYANSASVRLLLNGKEIVNKPVKKYKTLFKLPYQPGTLTAEALDERGNVISSHSLTTAGEETVLRVTPDKMVLCANNQALCYLPIEFTDKAGNLKPYMEQRVEVAVAERPPWLVLAAPCARPTRSLTNRIIIPTGAAALRCFGQVVLLERQK